MKMKNLRDKTIKYLIYTLLVLFQQSVFGQNTSYDIEIIYSDVKKLIRDESTIQSEMRYKDSLLVFFESGFVEDSVLIKTDFIRYEKAITSDLSLGYADMINVGKRNDINNFTIKINNGKTICIEPDDNYKYITINYVSRKKVLVQFLNVYPYYD
jgi:hypothetical protein